uniref:enkurin domain-containing protein 1 isoform X1 n=1 Tax=Lonchura striata TaxID=40157 RepID=UPI000B4CD83B|nr:enkurin domain-containing protein 1 isoform X1 [Lonchura striata domestica]XP_021396858.1 enkurin domain-containing protein 1 isoform X1 [Lonchura striata domestica]
MCEGPSRISGPIPPDPTLFPEYYKRPVSARGRLEGNAQKMCLTCLDPVANPYPALGSARQAQPAPRIRPSGQDFLERGQKGTLSLLLQLQGISLDEGMPAKRKEAKDYEKENVRRIKEIQKKCKEKERAQERSQPKPVKALWKSQKYENVESKVKAKLQETSPPPNPEAVNFLRAYSRCGSGVRPCRPLSPRPVRAKAGADTEAQAAETKPAGEEGAVAQADGGAAAEPARPRHAARAHHDARGPAPGDPRQPEAEPRAADKGPGSAANAWRQSQDAEEASRAREEALPDRRGNQNFLKAKSFHQVGLLSWWGQVCCAALPEPPLLLGRNGHHFLGGKERKPSSRPWARAGVDNSVHLLLASLAHLSVLCLVHRKGREML